MCNESTADFYENNDHALRPTNIVLRDSLGYLAVQILSKKFDLDIMDYSDMLRELHSIISDLQCEYHQKHGYFPKP